MQTVKPAPTQLFCKPERIEGDQQTETGLWIPKKGVEQPKTAEIINVGDGVKGFKPKERIIYKSYTTNDIKLNGDDFFLVDVEDVLGTVIETQ